LDRNGDGKLVYDEYKAIYEAMDTNRDIEATTTEVTQWVNSNVDSLCSQERERILGRLAASDLKDEHSTPPVNRLYNYLDADNS